MKAGTRRLTGGDGRSYEFDPGSLCLELLLTGGPGPYGSFETLHSPADLAGWLTASRLAATAPLAPPDPRITPAELRKVRRLRDTLWTVMPAAARGERPAGADLEVLNESAATALRPALDPATGRRRWVTPVTGAQLLGTAAREAIDIIGGEGSARLRECGADDCRLLFLDTSRPGTRRWCSMQRCGNRHKVRTYRGKAG
ncbi:CGNR zinc finger domain-containing protein [Qaidamihabitans albus]|uniref:CGNR zinc finger domain-containing protein n=1 Tax=Qaidamihabitans albus TaxID=2795733 RepID=UPI0018F239AE|nr:ABATE domain-containing protein [Qaidamihabitans albus]